VRPSPEHDRHQLVGAVAGLAGKSEHEPLGLDHLPMGPESKAVGEEVSITVYKRRD
jgi:hypothetical protein